MRFVVTLWTLLTAVSPAAANATYHAVHFIDTKEGWIAGDDGIIEHTIDGGKTWEHQASGTKASLRGIAFLDEMTGWIVGREEKPYGGGSVGVLLYTRDGGIRWQQLLVNAVPGLNAVRFTDRNTGFIMGDGQDPFGSGVFRTVDGGKMWDPVPGTRTSGWSGGDFQNVVNGWLVGPNGKLATYADEQWHFADAATFAGRGLRAVQIVKGRLIAVGEGGMVLTSTTRGQKWAHADLGMPAEARTCLDFNAIATAENRIWIAGRPGSVVLRSDDGGTTWAIKNVRPRPSKDTIAPGRGQMPIRSLCFVDKNHGWAVGAGSLVLATSDGGDTWVEVQSRSFEMLLMHAQAKAAALDTVACLRGGEPELPAFVVAMTREGAGAQSPSMTDRLHTATRTAGGFGAEELAAFTLPQYLQSSSKEDILSAWNVAHGRNAAHELLRHLVLALRMWQPTVIITEDPSAAGAEGLLAEAVKEAAKRAADPKEFPEQLDVLGLNPSHFWSLFAAADRGSTSLDTSSLPRNLDGIPRELAAAAHGYVGRLPTTFPLQRSYQFVRYGEYGRKNGRELSQVPALTTGTSIDLSNDGSSVRRFLEAPQRDKHEKNIRQIVNLVERLPRSEMVLGQLLPLLIALPQDDAARAAFTVANAYLRIGEWDLARETFLLMVDRAPTHPLSAEAYRWLVQHNVSSEVRRRYELQQFALVRPENSLQYSIAKNEVRPSFDFKDASKGKSAKGTPEGAPKKDEGGIQQISAFEVVADLFPPFAATKEIRQWSRGALEINKRFEVFGPLATIDPRVQFSVQAARRNLGEGGAARAWHERFAGHVIRGPWAEAATAELWVAGTGPKPRSIAKCLVTDERPTLDGKLDDACWKAQLPMTLTDASGSSQADYPTEAWFAYDAEFLYIAVRCKHPAGRSAPPVKVRPRDANLDAYDRVSLLLDLDRDYATYYRLEFDQRGCVREDCWGDLNWNPKWYVAAHAAEDSWCVEAAIPLAELTSSPVTLGSRWACNLVRIVPGRGVQSVSQPADVEPRPEGMCVLQFHQDARRTAPPMATAP